MSDKILVTGFDSFGRKRRPNRSSEIALPSIAEKYGDLVDTLVLPTARDIAAEQLLSRINDIEPAAVVMFGISAGSKVRLERYARNIKYSLFVPDNLGGRAFGRIDPQGDWKYASTLPLEPLYNRLDSAGVPTRFSNDAQTFICNEVSYRALQANDRQPDVNTSPTGFVHFGNGLSDQLVADASVLIVDELIRYQQTLL